MVLWVRPKELQHVRWRRGGDKPEEVVAVDGSHVGFVPTRPKHAVLAQAWPAAVYGVVRPIVLGSQAQHSPRLRVVLAWPKQCSCHAVLPPCHADRAVDWPKKALA